MLRNLPAQKDFSVIIPTFNRADFLRRAILSILRQRGVSFEVVVGDNCSSDNTEEVVRKFKDNRIKYFKNKTNLGFSGNIKKCFKKASGKYIFTLGDDDFILTEDTLFKVLETMRKFKVGVSNIGAIYYAKSPDFPCKTFILSSKLIILPPQKDKKLSLKALDFNISFFTGLTFETSIINIDKITESFNYAYWPFVFDAIQKSGIAYIPDRFIVGRISLRFVPEYFSLKKLGKFYMEDYLNMMKKNLNAKDYKRHKKKFLSDGTILLPSIKLYSDNNNYLKVLHKLIIMDNSLLINPKFLLLAGIGFMPKFILNNLRNFMIYLSEKKTEKIVGSYNYFQDLKKLRF